MSALLKHVQRLRTNIVAVCEVITQRLKTGKFEKSFNYVNQIGIDYRNVAIDVIGDAKANPLKASIISSVACLLLYLIRTNPAERDFNNQLIFAQNCHSEIADSVRNSESYQHVMRVTQLGNARVLKRMSFGIMSVLYFDDFDANCGLFAAQCAYLRPQVTSLVSERIVDIGFAGKWRIIERQMRDFDVNCSEFQ